MFENFTALEVVVLLAVGICGLGFLAGIVLPWLYAWADRFLDRTRNSIKDEVLSAEKRGE